MSEIQVFIPTYNRPALVLNAIRSALSQDFDSFEVIVSDNSTNDETEIHLAQFEDKRLRYIRRRPSLPVIDHFNAILGEVTAEYFMIFHDDDIMHPDLMKTLYAKLRQNVNALAIGSNAKVIKDGYLQKKNYYPDLKDDIIISKRDEMIKRYLLYHMVPFTSYLYKLERAGKMRFESEKGGKYCDASFIIDISVVTTGVPL